jgi:hypothetical protein
MRALRRANELAIAATARRAFASARRRANGRSRRGLDQRESPGPARRSRRIRGAAARPAARSGHAQRVASRNWPSRRGGPSRPRPRSSSAGQRAGPASTSPHAPPDRKKQTAADSIRILRWGMEGFYRRVEPRPPSSASNSAYRVSDISGGLGRRRRGAPGPPRGAPGRWGQTKCDAPAWRGSAASNPGHQGHGTRVLARFMAAKMARSRSGSVSTNL